MKRLLCTRRVVALDRLDEYLPVWAEVVRAAHASRCRAWLFRRPDHEDHFLEFVEWDGGAVSDADREPVEAARAVLDETFGYGESTEWEEAVIS